MFRNIAYLCNPVRKQDDSQVLYDSKNVGNDGKWRDSLAQLVEHNTFNVGVSGSSPERITINKNRVQAPVKQSLKEILLP